MSNNYQVLSTKNVSPKSTEINLSVNNISLERALEYYGTQNRIHFLYIQISIYKICIYKYDYLYMYNIKYKCINKTCTQISLNYKTGYPISNKFYFWSVRTYCISFDRTKMEYTTTLEKKNWLRRIVTVKSYKTLVKMDRESTRHTKDHFRQMVRINGHWHWITRFCGCLKNSIWRRMLYQICG